MKATTCCRVLALALWLLACGTVVRSAMAQTGNVEQARAYFQMGAKAYEEGKYLVAVQAFEQAYRLAERHGLVFSMGQAYRKLYVQTKRPEYLRAALDKYRAYVEKAPSGSRRADADEAIAELEQATARLAATTGEEGEAAAPPPLPALERKTHLSVTTVPKDAEVTVDGKALADDEAIVEVEPGKHEVVARSEGHFDEVMEVAVPEGGVVPIQIRLRPKPARVSLELEEEGADVYLDGRPVGLTPLSTPLELPAGDHFIAVSMNGRDPFAEELSVRRGEERQLDVELDATAQRITSYVFFGSSVALAGAAAVFTGVALYEQSQAKDIAAQAASGNIEPGELTEYNDALDRRNRLRLVAGFGWAAAAVTAGAGLFLFSFDEPKIEAPPRRERSNEPGPEEQEPAAPATMEIGAAPFALPGAAGAVVVGRF